MIGTVPLTFALHNQLLFCSRGTLNSASKIFKFEFRWPQVSFQMQSKKKDFCVYESDLEICDHTLYGNNL